MQKGKRKKGKGKSVEEIVGILLKNRGIKTKKQREEFFIPPHPDKIGDGEVGISGSQMRKAIKRIKQAVKSGEKIIIYGDYDVDGICAAAILWETLNSMGANVLPHIPSRFTEGYGLNIESIKKLKEEDQEIALIITVDNGIVANEKVDFAKSLGIDVIITDHHQPGATLPRAHAIVHTTVVSGSAVAWFLAKELRRNFKFQISNFKFFDDHLGLAALGTVADVLPLVGYNRSIVKHGLEILRTTSRHGIVALCQEAAVRQKEIDTFHIGFVIAPRLNAAGRVEHAMNSLRLLCTTKKDRAQTLARELGQANRLRQEKTKFALTHIEETCGALWQESTPGILFACHERYEEGVVGIVAGRLVEKYWRPAIVMSQGQAISKASARSVSGINIIDMIRIAGEGLLVNAGGHPMAAGFTIETKSIEVFSSRLLRVCEQIPKEAFVKDIRIDCEIDFAGISPALYERILEFAPFGFGNPQPAFKTSEVYVKNARLVGRQNEHLKLILYQQVSFDAIAFRMGELYPKFSPDEPINIVYSIEEDRWNGDSRLQLKIKNLAIDR